MVEVVLNGRRIGEGALVLRIFVACKLAPQKIELAKLADGWFSSARRGTVVLAKPNFKFRNNHNTTRKLQLSTPRDRFNREGSGIIF